MLSKIYRGTKKAHYLHEFGVSYFSILSSLPSNKEISLNIDGMEMKMRVRTAMYLAMLLHEIKSSGWNVKSENGEIVFENGNIKLYSNDIFYAGTINEVFVREVYKSNIKGKVVIDVGAYFGETAIYFALQGAKKVVALEPDEDAYKFALRNVKENKLEDRITLLNKAVAPRCSKVNYYKAPGTASSTDYENMFYKERDKVIAVKQVEAVTLDEAISMVEERIGLLKMDCEGCEYSVLNSFSGFDKIDEIILEYHNGLQNLPSLLKSYGFKVIAKGDRLGILRANRI